MVDYGIFGVAEGAGAEEIENAYNGLRKKYRGDLFLSGEAGADAARSLERLEAEYKKYSDLSARPREKNDFEFIEELIKNDNSEKAQQELDKIVDRPAEWHFLQALVYYRKSWFLECRKHLEIALKMEPDNKKYKENYLSLLAFAEVLRHKRFAEEKEAQENLGGDCCSGNSGACTAPCISGCCFKDED